MDFQSNRSKRRESDTVLMVCRALWNQALHPLMIFAALPEDPPTPLWELILEQFKDQLVLILLGSAAVSFVLALFEEGGDWTAFVDPVVVCHHTIHT